MWKYSSGWFSGILLSLMSLSITFGMFRIQLLGPSIIAVLLGALCLIVFPLSYTLLFPLIILYYQPVIKIQGMNVTIADLAIVLIAVSAFLLPRRHIDTATRRTVYVLCAMAISLPIFSAFGAIITWEGSRNSLISALIYVKRFSEYAILLIMIPYLRNFRSMTPMINVMVIGIIIAALSAMIPGFNNVLISQVDQVNFGERRVGLLLNPNIAGDFALLYINFGIAIYVFGKGFIQNRWAYTLLTVIPGLILMTLSGSRAVVVAALACGLVWLLKGLRNRRALILVSAVFVAGVLYLSLSPNNTLSQRWSVFMTEGIQERNFADRLDSQAIGLEIFQTSPIFGIGGGTLEDISRQFGKDIHGTDSQYIDTMIETGVFGLLALLAVLGCFLYYGSITGGVFGNSLVINTIGMIVAGFSGYTFYNPFIASYMWFFFLMATLERHYRSRPRGSLESDV